MSDGMLTEARFPTDRTDERVDAIAVRALTVVASRPGRVAKTVNPVLADLLLDAALSLEEDAFAPVLARLSDCGIRPEEIADLYVPHVARRMGDRWCEDSMGFAAVTIGVSRLQMLLRELGPAWRGDITTAGDVPSLLVMVAADVYHTLGAMVLVGQLRRKGLAVRLLVGARPADVEAAMRQARFDGVMISSSFGETLESLRKLVDAVKTSVADAPPVVLGGTILQSADTTLVMIAAQTGADHLTSDPDEALKLCGLKISANTPAHPPRRT